MSKLRGLLSGIFAFIRRFGAWLRDTLFQNRLDAVWAKIDEIERDTTTLEEFAYLWLNAEDYVLIPTKEISRPYDVFHRCAHGYEGILLVTKHAPEVIDNLLKAGADVISEEELIEFNKVENFWGKRASEFVLVRLDEKPERLYIYNTKFKDYATWLVIPKPMNYDYVIRKMRQAGVQIVSRDDVERLRDE